MLIINVFKGIIQLSLFLVVKLSFILGLIKLSTYNKFLIWIIKYNGPVSIKIFQILSCSNELNHIMGKDFINKIKKLQDNIYPNRRISINNFESLDKNPIATGTVGQIYTINLTKKREGILKIAHKNIRKEIKSSINSFKLVKNIFKIINKKIYNLVRNINLNEFSDFLINQSNFELEAKNILSFNKIFKNYDMIHIPKVIDYSNDYLIMSKEKGFKIEEFRRKYPEYLDETVSLIFSSVYFMIKNKIVHGDLHFGNFLFNLNSNKKRVEITILDFGVTCQLTDKQSKYLTTFLKTKNKNKLILFLKEIMINIPESLEIDENSKDTNIIKKILNNDNIILPSNFISLFSTLKIVFELQAECQKLNPDFNKYILGYMIENDFY